jgi:hypothetical protein
MPLPNSGKEFISSGVAVKKLQRAEAVKKLQRVETVKKLQRAEAVKKHQRAEAVGFDVSGHRSAVAAPSRSGVLPPKDRRERARERERERERE